MVLANKKISILILAAMCFCLGKAAAQNVNTPNKTGPMGTEVNTISGNMDLQRTDLFVPGRGLNFSFDFYYNSVLFDVNYGFGKGWDFHYHIFYINDTAQGKKIIWGDGSTTSFKYQAGAYVPEAGFFSTLSEYQPGKFLVKQNDGYKFYFDNSTTKRITRLEDRSGNFLNFTYSDTLLTAITNAAGQTITLAYSNGNLAAVTDALMSPSRIYTYSYDAGGNLTQETDPLGGTNKYSYLINGPMKSAKDENNNLIDIIYYPDFSVSEIIGCNKRMSFSYDTTIHVTTATDYVNGTNQITKYNYTRQGESYWLSALTSNCCGYNMSFTYDGSGNALTETDANGHVTTYTYDSRGNILTETDPLNQTTTYTYDSRFNFVTSITDPKGFLTTMSYDTSGNLLTLHTPGNLTYTATYAANGEILSMTDRNGGKYNFGRDAYGRFTTIDGPNGAHADISFSARGTMLSYKDGRGYITSIDWDVLNRATKLTEPNGKYFSVAYDAASNPTVVTDQSNQTVTLSYDASNRLVRYNNVEGKSTTFSYDGMNNLLALTNTLGNITSNSFDTRNRVTASTDAAGNVFSYSYDNKNNVVAAVRPEGENYSLGYDAGDRLISVGDQKGSLLTAEYDRNGNVTKLTDAVGAVTTAIYDSLNRMYSMTDALGNSETFVYDNNGNLAGVTDMNGQTSYMVYDSLNRAKTFTDRNGKMVSAAYDAEDNIISLTDQNNNVTTYAYDSLERVKSMTFPDGKSISVTYDSRCNVVTKTLTDGTIMHYAYDSLNRMVTKTLPDGRVFTYTYDAFGRVITATNDAGTVSFGYDAINRLTSETFDGRTVTYTYNTSGRLQTTTYPDSSVIIKSFDTRGNPVSISKNGAVIVTYQYDNVNHMIGAAYANGITTTKQYDYDNRLSGFSTGSGAIQNTSFTYDNDRDKITVNRLNQPDASEQYSYDNLHRVTTYKRGTIGGTPVFQSTYTYDNVGNRTAANLNSSAVNYTVNNLNQVTAGNGAQNISYTYDNRGNLTFDGIYYKSYDAENRLLEDSASPSNVIRYLYDAIGRRVQKIYNGVPLKYTYAAGEEIEERDGITNALRNSTVFNYFLQPVLNEHNGQRYYYHLNEMNSVEAITDATGALAEKYQYDLYGKPSLQDGTGNPIAFSKLGNRFGFTGQEYDSITGNYHFIFRDYNSQTGLFDQRDLIGYSDGMGMYQYVHDNPANGVDVFGLSEEDCEGKEHHHESEWHEWFEIIHHSSHIMEWLAEHKKHLTEEEIEELMKMLQSETKIAAELKAKGAAFSEIRQALSTANELNADLATDVSALGKTLKNTEGALKGLEVAGTALNLLNLGVEAYKLKHAENEEQSYDAKVGLARAGSNFTPAGAAFNVLDWGTGKYVQKLTGEENEGITSWEGSTIGNYYGLKAINKELDDEAETRELLEKQGKLGEYFEIREKLETRQREWEESHRKSDCPHNEPHEGPHDPGHHGPSETDSSRVTQAHDPNLIIGPDGVPQKAWVSVKDRLPYTIIYENSKSATAPAKYVRVTTPVEPKEEASSFRLGSFGFNNQTFTVPPNTASYYQRLDVRDSLGLYVDVTAGYDQINNVAFWQFQSIDPVTLLPPADPLKGFLLLQDSTRGNDGNGFVNFSIVPKATDVTLDTIGQKAAIVFDSNDTIGTNIAKNTIDAFAPTSHMNPLPATSNNPVMLSWGGHDDTNGCGLWYYTLYASTDGVNFNIVRSNITRTDTTFTGTPNTNYTFFVLATDSVGNTEVLGPGATTSTFIGSVVPVTWLSFTGITIGKDNILNWATANEQNSKEFKIERSRDAITFTAIGTQTAAGNSSTIRNYQYKDLNIDKLNMPVMFYRIKQIDLNGNFKYSNIVRLTYNTTGTTNSIVYPNPTNGWITVTVGDPKLIGTEAVLIDVNGRLLETLKITGNSISIDLGKYVNGTYFIKLSNKEVLRVVKL